MFTEIYIIKSNLIMWAGTDRYLLASAHFITYGRYEGIKSNFIILLNVAGGSSIGRTISSATNMRILL